MIEKKKEQKRRGAVKIKKEKKWVEKKKRKEQKRVEKRKKIEVTSAVCGGDGGTDHMSVG